MKRTTIPIAILLALAASACRSSSHASRDELAVDSDAAIEAELEILDPKVVARGESRALEFGLRNASGHDLEFRFTVDWFDAQGRPVALSPRGWSGLAIERHIVQPVRVEPMPQEARSWRLRFSFAGSR